MDHMHISFASAAGDTLLFTESHLVAFLAAHGDFMLNDNAAILPHPFRDVQVVYPLSAKTPLEVLLVRTPLTRSSKCS
jgi:hypothetical protein